MEYQILVIDDEQLSCDSTKLFLEEHGYQVDTATTSSEALEKIKLDGSTYAAILLDFHLKGDERSCEELIQEIFAINPDASVLIYSADQSTEVIRKSWDAGAVGFIEKDNEAQLLERLENESKKFEETKRVLSSARPETDNEKVIASLGMIGRSGAIAEVAQKVKRYRDTDETVIIYGNTGTGKELIARALCRNPERPFLTVNCAAFKDAHLLETELFGYVRGAFTGADRNKAGIFELALDGTVFLDEIHQLSPDGQSKLLRAFQEKKIRKVGDSKEIPVKFRLIVAAKPELPRFVDEREFLPDLYYRINKLPITVPDLRDRTEDVEPLVAHFTERHCKKYGVKKDFRMKTVRILEKYNWPGNVRELENTVCRLLTDCQSGHVEPEHLDAKFFSHMKRNLTWDEIEKKHFDEKKSRLLQVLSSTRTKAQAAEALNIQPTTLHSLRIKYGLYAPKNGKRMDESSEVSAS